MAGSSRDLELLPSLLAVCPLRFLHGRPFRLGSLYPRVNRNVCPLLPESCVAPGYQRGVRFHERNQD